MSSLIEAASVSTQQSFYIPQSSQWPTESRQAVCITLEDMYNNKPESFKASESKYDKFDYFILGNIDYQLSLTSHPEKIWSQILNQNEIDCLCDDRFNRARFHEGRVFLGEKNNGFEYMYKDWFGGLLSAIHGFNSPYIFGEGLSMSKRDKTNSEFGKIHTYQIDWYSDSTYSTRDLLSYDNEYPWRGTDMPYGDTKVILIHI